MLVLGGGLGQSLAWPMGDRGGWVAVLALVAPAVDVAAAAVAAVTAAGLCLHTGVTSMSSTFYIHYSPFVFTFYTFALE